MMSFSNMSGLPLFAYQMSKRDCARKIQGSREYYWYKDTDVPYSPMNVPTNSVITITDTDYYVDTGSRHTLNVTKQPLTIASVESRVKDLGMSYHQAAMLCDYYRSTIPQQMEHFVFPVAYSVKRFQWISEASDYDPDAKPSMVPFMSPIVNNAITPDCTLSNEKRCIQERVTKLKAEDRQITPGITQYAMEFARLLIPVPHQTVPFSDNAIS